MKSALQKLSAIKGKFFRGAEESSQYVYLAHGCFFFLTPELAEALCEKPYGEYAEHEYGELVEEDLGVHTPTEVKDGMSSHYFCDTCDTYFDTDLNSTTEEDLVIKVEHTYGELIAKVDAIHNAEELTDGMEAYYICSECEGFFTEVSGC